MATIKRGRAGVEKEEERIAACRQFVK